MANFAQVTGGVVTWVIVVADADCSNGVLPEADITGSAFIQSLGLSGVWMLTDINDIQRKNYAGIGYTYDTARDAFIAPKPYASWVLDEATCRWGAPVAMPSEGGPWAWDEDTESWVAV